jgi:hypothetical protein
VIRNQRKVEVEPKRPAELDGFRQGLSFEELAQQQGVRPVESLEVLLGGWPADEVDDSFEKELARWRGHEAKGSREE